MVLRSAFRLAVATSLVLSPLLKAAPARAADPMLKVLPPEERSAAPAQRYAALSHSTALAELRARGVSFAEIPPEQAPGVRTPIRLTDTLHGVAVHGMQDAATREHSPFEILDARLALSLDDFATILRRHDVNEMVHFTIYRPPGRSQGKSKAIRKAPAHPTPKRTSPHGIHLPSGSPKPLSHAHQEVAWTLVAYPDDASTAAPLALTSPAAETNSEESADTQKTSRHPAGLAIDVAVFRKTDGSTLSVRQHFHGQIGAKTCRPGDGSTGTEETRELHAILCEAAAENVFTYILSPNFNRAHYDHFHMEVKSGVRWTLVH